VRGAGLIVLAGVAAGLVAAAVVNLVEDSHSRAETTLVLQRGPEPIDSRGTARTFAQLVRTDAVASNVVRNLRLDESASDLLDRVSVAVYGNALLRVRVEDEERTRARQIAQELALVFTQLVRDRFSQGSDGTPVTVAVFDPAHALPGKTSRGLAHDLAWGAVLGALVGAVAAQFRRPRPRVLEG
jgi:capsular polysaccharide biosynthesis protein